MTVPNVLCWLRLASVPVLLLLAWWQQYDAYFWLLLFALGTDLADGFIARHFNMKTKSGALLDSRADMALFLTAPVGLYLLFPEVFDAHAVLLIGVLTAYVLADLVGYLKWKRLPSYHTLGAKLSAVLLGAAAISLFLFPGVTWPLYLGGVVAIIAYTEEIFITMTLTQWETDVPHLWAARKKRG